MFGVREYRADSREAFHAPLPVGLTRLCFWTNRRFTNDLLECAVYVHASLRVSPSHQHCKQILANPPISARTVILFVRGRCSWFYYICKEKTYMVWGNPVCGWYHLAKDLCPLLEFPGLVAAKGKQVFEPVSETCQEDKVLLFFSYRW